MSRRFGRNQKRAMRQELEAWQQANAMTEGLLRHVSNQRDRLHDDLDTVRSALGPNFIGLPVDEVALKLTELHPDDQFRMPVGPAGDEIVSMHTMRVRDIDDDNPKACIHLRVTLAGVEAAYAMSEQALFGMKVPDSVLVGHIVRELAPFVLKAVRKRRGGR